MSRSKPEPDSNSLPIVGGESIVQVTDQDFTGAFGEDLQRTLDVDTWSSGEDLALIYDRLAAEVREAVEREESLLRTIREEVFPRLATYPGAPRGAGVYEADLSVLERIHRGLLFNGGVEACDGNRHIHDTLPLTVFQIGVCLVSYQGSQGTWSQRLFRRDLRVTSKDPREEMLAVLERRERRAGLNQTERRDQLTELAQRGIMSYAERAILLRRSTAKWRMGHGNPAPYELVTGSGSPKLMIEATRVIRELVERHQRFLFVASEPADRVLLTIGQALRPLEFAIVGTLREQIDRIVERGHYGGWGASESDGAEWDGELLTPEAWIKRFRDVVASQVVVGVYRASRVAPAQLFYAHVDHAYVAAHIALADSVLQEHRGYPLLLDIAHSVCSSIFGAETLAGPVATAYIDVGAPWRFLSERASRYL
ncbi:hypothetical protein NET02_04885 [Thermomicrobiaceae bacterium CFH 74404]|uniref:Uncharacterized protein n=1 Tax=Thermalbibacter longus TaxID=2951981 RepID=A0AA42BC70_9BACT|nr:hypothetical protein [Thermalbibacter longus]MCM8748473.1 hypothetical protein [Thermalbibacter longus]